MNKSAVVLLFLIPVALIGCQSTSPTLVTTYVLGYASGTQQNQVVAAGSNTNLGVTVSASAGGSASGLALTASVNNSYCTLGSNSATTDANGNASFNLTAGSGSGLSCSITVSLPAVNASRSTLGFTVSIRNLQRGLSAPNASLNVPTTPNPSVLDLSKVSALMTLSSPHAALGSANDSFALRVSGLPPAPTGFTYVLWATDAASVTTGLDAFRNASNSPFNVNYVAPPPANTGSISPATPTDNKANFTRVFVTVESGAAIPATPSTLIALDTGSSIFVQSY
jgi:hypothetical protein